MLTAAQLEDLKKSVEEWRDAELQRIADKVEYLKSLDVSVSAVGESSVSAAADLAEDLVASYLGT